MSPVPADASLCPVDGMDGMDGALADAQLIFR